MATAICRIQRIGGAKDSVGIQLHNRRERTHSNSNPDIDRERSKDNYTLTQRTDASYNALVDRRLHDAYTGSRAIRKDAVRLCEALFTASWEFFDEHPEQTRDFFMACYAWACERFGKDNIIEATVHMDEETPHMHLDFVPLTADGRLSAKSVLGNRNDMQKLQDDFYEHVGKQFDMDRGQRADLDDPNADRPARHKTMRELKADTLIALEQAEAYNDASREIMEDQEQEWQTWQQGKKVREDELRNMQREIDSLAVQIAAKENLRSAAQSDLEALRTRTEALRREEADLTSKIKELQETHRTLSDEEIEALDVTPRKIGGGFKGMTPQQAQELMNTVAARGKLVRDQHAKIEDLTKTVSQLQSQLQEKQEKDARLSMEEWQRKINERKEIEDLRAVKREFATYQAAIAKLPHQIRDAVHIEIQKLRGGDVERSVRGGRSR